MQAFEHLIGNDAAKHYLRHMLDTRNIPKTMLFYGMDGVGKALFAQAFGKQLGIHFEDIQEYRPEGKSVLHSLSSLHEFIDEARSHPFNSPYKLLLVHDADRMLPSGANALLKSLEEPLATSIIILLTVDKSALLETITSRACAIPFYPIAEQELIAYLTKSGYDEIKARKVAKIAHGSLGQALRCDIEESRERCLRAMLHAAANGALLDAFECAAELDNALEANRKDDPASAFYEAQHLLTLAYYWYRDQHLLAVHGLKELLFFHDSTPVETIPSPEEMDALLIQAREGLQAHMKLKTLLEQICIALSQVHV